LFRPADQPLHYLPHTHPRRGRPGLPG